MVKLVNIDYHEKQTRQSAFRELLVPEFQVDTVHLITGDYQYKDVGIEYKSMSDMVSSIIDKRVFNECIELAEAYKYPYLVIAGSINDILRKNNIGGYGRISVNAYLGALASLSSVVNILAVENEHQSLELMKILFKRLDNKKVINAPKLPSKKASPPVNYLSTIKGISVNKADFICDKLEVKTLDDLLKVELEDLTSLQGIGNKTAEGILKYIK